MHYTCFTYKYMQEGYNLRMIISYEDDCLMSPVAVSSFIFFHHLFLFLSDYCFCSYTYVPWNSLTFFKLSIKPKNCNCFFFFLSSAVQLIHSIFFSSFSHFQFNTNWTFDISRNSIRYKTKTMSIKHFSRNDFVTYFNIWQYHDMCYALLY